VLGQIRRDLMMEIPVYLDAPSLICLFTYDNNTFITQSYQPGPTRYKIVVKKAGARLFDLRTGAQVRDTRTAKPRYLKYCRRRERITRTGSSKSREAFGYETWPPAQARYKRQPPIPPVARNPVAT